MRNIGRYDYAELRAAAVKGDQSAIDDLGRWFDMFYYWSFNGEYYDVDGGLRLFPVYRELTDDNFELDHYELRP